MDIKLIIFDMDGLMFDSENLYCKSTLKAIEELGYEPSIDVFKKTLGFTDLKTREFYSSYYGEGLDTLKLYELTFKYLNELLDSGELTKKPGLLELIDYLDKNNIKKAIASSSPKDIIFRNLEITEVTNTFDYIISGEEVKESKPNPEIFIKVCDFLNIARENALVLEDSINGIRAGYSAGIKSIMIPDLAEPTDETKEKSHLIVSSLFDVIDILEKSNR